MLGSKETIISANYRNIQKLVLVHELEKRFVSENENICVSCTKFVRFKPIYVAGRPCELFIFSTYSHLEPITSNTHLAFHFYCVTFRIPQRLRLIKAPIHFLCLQFFSFFKSSAAFARRKRGSGPGVFCFNNPPASSPVEEFVSSLIYFTSWSFLSMRSVRVQRGLHGRRGGELLAALTWDCELSFEMTSALLKNGIL